MEDHTIRIRTPRIIKDAVEANPELEAMFGQEIDGIKAMYNCLRVHAETETLCIMAVGKPGDERKLRLLVDGMLAAYRDYLSTCEFADIQTETGRLGLFE